MRFRLRYHSNIVQEPSQRYVRMSNTEAMNTKHVTDVLQ